MPRARTGGAPPPGGRSAGAPGGRSAHCRGRPAPVCDPLGRRAGGVDVDMRRKRIRFTRPPSSPAGPRSPPDPGRRRSPPRQPPPRRHPHRLRPGRDPVRRPRHAPDQPRHAPHARSTGAQPPMWTAHAPLGGSRAAINGPSALRSARNRPSTRSGAAHVADRSARGQPASASSPARADRLRDPRHPPPAPPVSSRRGT